jgi:hypothetical protein
MTRARSCASFSTQTCTLAVDYTSWLFTGWIPIVGYLRDHLIELQLPWLAVTAQELPVVYESCPSDLQDGNRSDTRVMPLHSRLILCERQPVLPLAAALTCNKHPPGWTTKALVQRRGGLNKFRNSRRWPHHTACCACVPVGQMQPPAMLDKPPVVVVVKRGDSMTARRHISIACMFHWPSTYSGDGLLTRDSAKDFESSKQHNMVRTVPSVCHVDCSPCGSIATKARENPTRT